MDLSPITHAAFAVAGQLAIGAVTGDWLIGGLLGACWFAAREHTQAEYRWIKAYGGGQRVNMPWWGGFSPSVWTLGSTADWVVPTVSCLVTYLIISAP